MMKKTLTLTVLTLAAGALALPTALPAANQTGAAIKQNMQKRLPALNAMLRKELLGEANTGFLEIRSSVTEDEKKLVEAENQDRKTVYTAIAKQQKTTAELVGQRRAKQIAERAPAGTWIQDADDKWRKK